jgi:hypothetical protein
MIIIPIITAKLTAIIARHILPTRRSQKRAGPERALAAFICDENENPFLNQSGRFAPNPVGNEGGILPGPVVIGATMPVDVTSGNLAY